MTDTEQCPICIEAFNQTIRKKIECVYCHYESCSGCTRQYLLSNIQDPHCMSCRRSWNREILMQLFPQTFVNKDYKIHRERVLYERECSLLPETQAKVARIRARRELEQEQTRMIRLYNEKKKELKELNLTLMDIQRNIRDSYNDRVSRSTTVRVEIIRKCPNLECRGFIQKNHTCGICNSRICSQCHEILKSGESDPVLDKKKLSAGASTSANPDGAQPESAKPDGAAGHQCKEADIETAKMILKQTRPCPSCFVSIYKIDGCDQMWCTQCHTAFSWRTGAIETMRIHNPHFYQWQMERANAEGQAPPREPGDIPCGGLPTIYEIRHWFNVHHRERRHYGRRLHNLPTHTEPANPEQPDGFSAVLSIHRIVLHIESTELRRFRVQAYTDVELNETLRIDYLMNLLTEDAFKKQLQQIEKKRQKKSAIYMILEMFVHTSGDIFRNYLHVLFTQQAVQQMIREFLSLREYLNQQLRLVSRQFNCKVPNISPAWGMMNVDYKSPTYLPQQESDTETIDEAASAPEAAQAVPTVLTRIQTVATEWLERYEAAAAARE